MDPPGIRLSTSALLFAAFLSGCSQQRAFTSVPEPDQAQVLQTIYGVPTLISEFGNLVTLASEGNAFEGRQAIIFLRLWVYNGGGGDKLVISPDRITARLETVGGSQPIHTLVPGPGWL